MPGNTLRGITYHIVGGNHLIDQLLRSEDGKPKGLGAADIVVFQGGADLDPKLYGQSRHPRCDDPDTKRDRMEFALYYNLDPKQYKIGICRGAQFLNVINGGKLWQHIEGHRQSHVVQYVSETKLQRAYTVSSTHHQMMIPPVNGSGEIWGFAHEATGREFPDGTRLRLIENAIPDPEIIFFKKTQCLAFQPHPEYVIPKQTRDLFFRCITRMIEA